MSKVSIYNMAEGGQQVFFYCIGCETHHAFAVGAPTGPNWTWNGDPEKPDVNPSLLVNATLDPARRCHLFVRNGQIQYLSDCAHGMAGQTVDMVERDI